MNVHWFWLWVTIASLGSLGEQCVGVEGLSFSENTFYLVHVLLQARYISVYCIILSSAAIFLAQKIIIKINPKLMLETY